MRILSCRLSNIFCKIEFRASFLMDIERFLAGIFRGGICVMCKNTVVNKYYVAHLRNHINNGFAYRYGKVYWDIQGVTSFDYLGPCQLILLKTSASRCSKYYKNFISAAKVIINDCVDFLNCECIENLVRCILENEVKCPLCDCIFECFPSPEVLLNHLGKCAKI